MCAILLIGFLLLQKQYELIITINRQQCRFSIERAELCCSVARLRQLLACYNASQPIALGERYGYRAHTSSGYDYMTGGAG